MTKLKTADLKEVRIRDRFWDRYTHLVTEEILPYQWKVLSDELEGEEPSHALRNFRIAAGLETGDFYGFVFQDSDVAKWLEAAAYSLAWHPDEALEKKIDEVVSLLEEAQLPNGYLDTYFMIREPGREFINLREGHELYCAGHLIEAGCALQRVTGKDRLLKLCERMADHIVETFAPELLGDGDPDPKSTSERERLKRGVPGHEEIELALIRLFEVTGKRRYLEMAAEFLNRRGQEPNYLAEEEKHPGWKRIFPELAAGYHPDYAQADEPVRAQKTARGHAVRAVYLYCAMADAAFYTGDEQLLHACERLYENIVGKQMYITGSIGSSGWLERFSTDYDLPNAMNYSESCASIGLALFARRMAQITHEARYMDTAECALYNTVTAGVSLDGKRFFYVNPLAVWPAACMDGVSRSHVKSVRQKWFACACCPPNIARTLASLGEYCYFTDEEGFWVNLFVAGEGTLPLGDRKAHIRTETTFPFGDQWEMQICSFTEPGEADAAGEAGVAEGAASADEAAAAERAAVEDRADGSDSADTPRTSRIRIRIPEYAREVRLRLERQSNEKVSAEILLAGDARRDLPCGRILLPDVTLSVEKGYAVLKGSFAQGDRVQLTFDMQAVFMRAHPMVRADAGRVALKKGPLVYCLEQTDNGENLEQLVADAYGPVREHFEEDLLGGTLVVEAEGTRLLAAQPEEEKLYRVAERPARERQTLRFVPYAFWGNRTPGEMIVWVRE